MAFLMNKFLRSKSEKEKKANSQELSITENEQNHIVLNPQENLDNEERVSLEVELMHEDEERQEKNELNDEEFNEKKQEKSIEKNTEKIEEEGGSMEMNESNIAIEFNEKKLTIQEVEYLREKGRNDGANENFEGTDILVNGVKKTIYNSSLIMEELAGFINTRSKIYGNSIFKFTGEIYRESTNLPIEGTYRELVNKLERERNRLEVSIGKMDAVQTNNYRNAKEALTLLELEESQKLMHEQEIKSRENQVYRETRENYGAIINNLKEEILLIETANELIFSYFNETQERISCYWNAAKEEFSKLSVRPPSDAELLALKNETLYGEMNTIISQRTNEVKKYQGKRERLSPEGIIEKIFLGEDI